MVATWDPKTQGVPQGWYCVGRCCNPIYTQSSGGQQFPYQCFGPCGDPRSKYASGYTPGNPCTPCIPAYGGPLAKACCTASTQPAPAPAPSAPAPGPVGPGACAGNQRSLCYPVATPNQVAQAACQVAANANPKTAQCGVPQGGKYSYTPINACAPGQQLTYCPVNATHANASTVGCTAQAGLNTAQCHAQGLTACQASVQGQAQSTHYCAAQAGAAQGQVGNNCLVETNMNRILCQSPKACVGGAQVPVWAQTAVAASRAQMAALGLGASTMAGNATAAAILNTALPMAQQDAQTFANMNQTNVKNLQQTLLSNQAATNAARQFNAQSDTQVSEFMTGLATDISKFNTSQVNTMKQFVAAQSNCMAKFNAGQANQVGEFNAGQRNQVSEFNAQQENAISQFNANADNQVSEFNAQNTLLVNQSNVQWQRAVNTANTAEINATNNANAQNVFDLNQTALNNEWQMAADQASWAISQNQNAKNRELTLAIAAMNQKTALSILNSQLSASTFSQIGQFASNLFGGASGIGSSISKLFSGNKGCTTSNNCLALNTKPNNCFVGSCGACFSPKGCGCFGGTQFSNLGCNFGGGGFCPTG